MSALTEWFSKYPWAGPTVGVIVGAILTKLVFPLLIKLAQSTIGAISRAIFLRGGERGYLDAVIKEHQFIPSLPTTLVPVTDHHQEELDRIYISLNIKDNRQSGHAIGLEDSIKGNQRIVILGDPGAGKTTLLKFLVLTFARAAAQKGLLGSEKRPAWVAAKYKVRHTCSIRHAPIPIFIPLNKLRDIHSWDSTKTLLDWIENEYSKDKILNLPPYFFRNLIKKGRCIFLFDAYDELASKGARGRMAAEIAQLVTSSNSANRFIVSSRILGYQGQLAKHNFRALTIQPLSQESIYELVTKWFESLKSPRDAAPLLDSIEANNRLRELAINPMLLSLIVLVQYVKKVIPDKRHLLYAECVNILIERRFASPETQSQYNDVVQAEDAISILREVAQEMHKRKVREIAREELERRLIPDITNRLGLYVSGLDGGSILQNIEERSQLMVEKGLNDQDEPMMSFSHLTFQEYLAAGSFRSLASEKGSAYASENVLKFHHEDAEWWEEVALLYGAQLEGKERKEFAEQLARLSSYESV